MKIGNSEIFIAETNHSIKKQSLIYSPLARVCCLIDDAIIDQVHNSIVNQDTSINKNLSQIVDELIDYELPLAEKMLRQSPYEYTTLSLLPNQICNFHCSYCYSASGRSKKSINRNLLRTVLDYFIDSDRVKSNNYKLFISGGGEPFMTWETTKYGIEYACSRASAQDSSLWITIITNGSIISDNIIKTIKKHGCCVCISFEVLEDLQNALRGNFSKVSKTILEYGKAEVLTTINSTITPLSVNRMEEMLQEVLFRYPFIRDYTLEPVTDHTLFDSPFAMRKFYEKFIYNFNLLKEKYKNERVTIWCSLDDLLSNIKIRYCSGKLCLTPEGTFTICHCASSSLEERYNKSVYGEVNVKDGVVFDEDKFRQLIAMNMTNIDKCQDCIAKWNCGGECLTRRMQYSEEYMDELCNVNRSYLIQQLEDKFNLVDRSSSYKVARL